MMILGLFLSIALLHQPPFAVAKTRTYDIRDYGAKPDGNTDSSTALSEAWKDTCQSSEPSTLYVPSGRYLVNNKVHFKGPCNNEYGLITIRIAGTLMTRSSFGDDYWILLEKVDGITILGGVLEGYGSTLWACKNNGGGGGCGVGATSLGITNCNNVEINKLKSLNSQLFHIVINGCGNVKLQNVRIRASGESPNTDGIHIQRSSNVTVLDAHIATGDDCISIGPCSTNVWIEGVHCGPGHGISIGSLGRAPGEIGVMNVTVKDAHFHGTQNGFRIKTWATSYKEYVQNVVFHGAVMNNVQNPILIDQHYCPNHNGCPTEESGVQISDITYQDIQGTSATEIAVKFDCSGEKPCNGIIMKNINLTYGNGDSQMSCSNATGSVSHLIEPADSCL